MAIIPPKTIIILSSPRSGSRLLYDYLKYYSPKSNYLLNLNFWGLALKAINGHDKLFKDRLKQQFPYISIPDVITKDTVYELWDEILKNDGPVLVDKSPFYLDNFQILNLIFEYKKSGNDVRFISFIRHPLDAITSQEENGKYRLGHLSIGEREALYLKRYANAKRLQYMDQNTINCKYEDFLYNFDASIKVILNYLEFEMNNNNKIFIHGKSGRYNLSCNYKVRRWKISEDLKDFIKENRYPPKPKLLYINIHSILLKSILNEAHALYFTCLYKVFKKKN